MNIKQLKKELRLDNTKLAFFFDLAPTSFANSTAKIRYEQALCRFYKYVKEHEKLEPYEPDYFPKCVLCKSIHDPEICCQD